jgi:ABC-2 type transport system permease protein
MFSFVILYFIFTAFRGGSHDATYAANLFIGLILFTFFNEGVIFGMNSLLDMANILLKINFPRQIAILSSVIMASINLGVNFIVILIITISLSFRPNLVGSAYFLFIILIEFLLIYGISLFLSIMMVKIRDLVHVSELFFQLLFWCSAIFYSIDDMSGTTGDIIRMNPIAILIDAARKGFIKGEIAHLDQVIGIFIVTLIIIITGQIYFNKKIRRVAEYF